MTTMEIIMVSATVALLASSFVILAWIIGQDLKTEKKVDRLHNAIMSGDTETLYRMLNRLENDGTINTGFGKDWVKV